MRPPIEEMLMITPLCRSRKWGRNPLVTFINPVTLVAI